MRNRPWGRGRATFLALALAGVLGCTSGTPSPTTVLGPTGALASQLASAFCAAQATCCGAPAGAATPDGSTNRDGGTSAGTGACGTNSDAATSDGGPSTCVERATLAANQQLALVATASGEGLLTINETIASTCVDAYAHSSCAELAGQAVPDVQAALDAPACTNLFTGYIPVGNRCDMSQECVSGTYCLSQGTGQNASALAGSGTLGICFPFQGMNGACNTTDDCLPPLTCGATTLTCE
jgi:hypothetical protein